MAQSAWDIPYLNRKNFLLNYQISKSDFFLSLTFPISLSDLLLNSSIVESDNRIGKVNDKKI